MKKTLIETYEDIDWPLLWQNGRNKKSWRSKGAKDWDKKAPSFTERTSQSPYIPLFLSRLPLSPEHTVLDIGCGPGTLALPLADQVRKVTAIDYSKKMLAILDSRAKDQNISNIKCVHCSWEDDWLDFGIEPADITIASRSMNVDDLSMAIDKLNTFSKKYVFITDRIAPSPFDPDAFEAIGRQFNSGPDYIFTLNFLYLKNIHANVEVLKLDEEVSFASMEEALQSYHWMIKDLTPNELRKLEKFIESRVISSTSDKIVLHRRHPPQWAMIWWKKTEK